VSYGIPPSVAHFLLSKVNGNLGATVSALNRTVHRVSLVSMVILAFAAFALLLIGWTVAPSRAR
jgi:hypothetical protein